MFSLRVDKGWQDRGLGHYPTEAILGTLSHYGVTIDEAGFLKAAETSFPLGIAYEWHQTWSGTGQFKRFPAMAAEELWRRLKPGVATPADIALAIVKLLKALDQRMAGVADDGTQETRWKVVEAYVATLPPQGPRYDAFSDELVAAMGEWLEVFDNMAKALALKQRPDDAARFVALEEGLFPVRQGASSALVKAVSGERQVAVAELQELAGDATRSQGARLGAIDALLQLREASVAKPYILALLAEAQDSRDLDLASEAVEALSRVLEIDPQTPDRDELRKKVSMLAKALGA